MKRILVLFLFFLANKLIGQSHSVLVHKDVRIDSLISKQIQINDETTKDSRRNLPGFRILVITSNDRSKVFNAKAEVYQDYPELQPYIMYQAPNYKLKVGNFKTQEEAQVYLDKLIKIYTTGIYIVHDVIEVKPD